MCVEPKHIQIQLKDRSDIYNVRKTSIKKIIFLAVLQLFPLHGPPIADLCYRAPKYRNITHGIRRRENNITESFITLHYRTPYIIVVNLIWQRIIIII